MKKEYVAKLDKTAASKLANSRKQKEHRSQRFVRTGSSQSGYQER